MSGLDVAASLIACITLTLQSTKYVYTTISELKHAPKYVQELGSHSGRLQDLLEALRLSVERWTSPPGSPALILLKKQVDSINVDVISLENKIKTLQAKKGLRHLSAFFQSNDVERYNAALLQHKTTLTLALQTLGNDQGAEQIISIAKLQKGFDQLLLQSSSSASTLDTLAQNISGLQTLLGSSLINRVAGTDLTARLDALEQRLVNGHSLIEGSSHLPHSKTDSGLPYASHDNTINSKTDSIISNSIDRLSELANCFSKGDGEVASADLDELVENLEAIVETVLRPLTTPSGMTSFGQTTIVNATAIKAHSEFEKRTKEHKRMLLSALANMAASGEPVRVASHEWPARRGQAASGCLETFSTEHESDSGKITIATRARWLGVPGGTTEGNRRLLHVIAQFDLIPSEKLRRLAYNKMLSLRVYQEMQGNGRISISPVLSVTPIQLMDSDIYDACKRGDSEDLLSLVRTGKGSFRDVLPNGASLLGVAMHLRKYELAQLLMKNGASVNSHDLKLVTGRFTITKEGSIAQAHVDRIGSITFATQRLTQPEQVYRMLSNALEEIELGGEEAYSLFRQLPVNLFSRRWLQELHHISRDDLYGINELPTVTGFLRRLGPEGTVYNLPGKLQFMIDEGADPAACTRSGENSLHLLLVLAARPRRYDALTIRDVLASLIVVIRHGADTEAPDDHGRTPADLARHLASNSKGHILDLWTAAMVRTGRERPHVEPTDAEITRSWVFTPLHQHALIEGYMVSSLERKIWLSASVCVRHVNGRYSYSGRHDWMISTDDFLKLADEVLLTGALPEYLHPLAVALLKEGRDGWKWDTWKRLLAEYNSRQTTDIARVVDILDDKTAEPTSSVRIGAHFTGELGSKASIKASEQQPEDSQSSSSDPSSEDQSSTELDDTTNAWAAVDAEEDERSSHLAKEPSSVFTSEIVTAWLAANMEEEDNPWL